MSRFIKAFISFSLMLLLVDQICAQQEYTLHFTRNALQSSYYNPSFRSNHKFTIALPSLAYNYGNNAFSYGELVKHRDDSDSLYLDVDGVIDNMKAKNILQINLNVDLLSVFFYIKDTYITISMGEKLGVKFTYPKELISLVWNGNAQYVGQTVDVGPALNMTAYNELAVGVGHQFGKFDLGVRLRLLNGIANVKTNRSELNWTTDQDNFATTLSSDYEIYTSGTNFFEGGAEAGAGLTNNFGGAIDLGMNYKFNEKVELAFSVLDLGQINWKDDVKVYRSKGAFTYSGVNLSTLVDDKQIGFDDFRDTLSDLYFESSEGGSYTSYLIPKTYLSGMYKFNEKGRLGALVNLEFFDGVQYGLALHGGYMLGNFLDLGLTYSIKNDRYDNIGFNLGIGPRAFQFYVITDNLLNFLRADVGRNVTFRYALNINFGKLKKKEKAPEEDDATSLLYK